MYYFVTLWNNATGYFHEKSLQQQIGNDNVGLYFRRIKVASYKHYGILNHQ